MPAEDVSNLQQNIRHIFDKRLLQDTPNCILFEILGWDVHAEFASQWAALKAFMRFHCAAPLWHEHLDAAFHCKRWHDLFPGAAALLQSLGWWTSEQRNCICRTDSSGRLRVFRIGVDAVGVLHEWLSDWHKARALRQCNRVKRSLHRPDPNGTLASGKTLPAPRAAAICRFEGHVAMRQSDGAKFLKQAALATGCSLWHKHFDCNHFGADDERLQCMCGLMYPSRPHLVWCCANTQDKRPSVAEPCHRAEERLFARDIGERPAPPLDEQIQGACDGLADALSSLAEENPFVSVATDGSSNDGVGAWCVFLPGIHSEDQSPFRAEVSALLHVLQAISVLCRHGRPRPRHVLFVSDCLSAIQLVETGTGSARPLGRTCAALRHQCANCHIQLQFQWVPAHGRVVPEWAPTCGVPEFTLRAWNAAADREAKSRMRSLLIGSARAAWARDRKSALAWETAVITAVACIAEQYSTA